MHIQTTEQTRAEGALVSNTNSRSQSAESRDPEVFESIEVYDRFDTVSARFKLQRISAAFLVDSVALNGKSFRVSKCVYTRIASDVRVVLSPAGTASYKGVMYCGSVWTCPVCSAKISHYRKNELETSLDAFYNGGGLTYMLTLTVPHKRKMPLSDVLGSSSGKVGILRAFNLLTHHRTFSEFRKSGPYIGMVRALEVTYSLNGWHPHLHVLLFCTASIPDTFKHRLYSAWVTSCKKASLKKPNKEHGLDIRRAFSPAEYLTKFGHETKWGTSSELTKSHSKTGNKSMTAFDFLRTGSDHSKSLFQEYAKNFFGKRQLVYSPGLKNLLSITDIDDQAIASGDIAHSVVCTALTSDHWRRIINHDSDYNARSVVLRLAETGGASAVLRFVDSLDPF